MGKHRQNLIESEAVLIYSTNQNQTWLQSKIMDCLKAPGYGKKQSFLAKAVLTAQPLQGRNLNQLNDFIILTDHKDMTQALQPLLDKLIKHHE